MARVLGMMVGEWRWYGSGGGFIDDEAGVVEVVV